MSKDTKRRILLNDVLLRESGQVEAGGMTLANQYHYIEMMIKGGIDIIEVGYPASLGNELQRCRDIVSFVGSMKVKKRPILSGLARSLDADILAVKDTGFEMVHVYIQASDQLISTQFYDERHGVTLKEKRNWVLRQAVEAVGYAKSLGFKHIQFSPEDAARADREFLCQLVESVIDSGATSVNIPDTTGICVMNEFGDLIRHLVATVPNIGRARLACHCHNDTDNATANALEGALAGVDEVQGTFYGLGERSGMTKFESFIMNIQTRQDVFGSINIEFDSTLSCSLVNFLGAALNITVPRHWVVVGEQNSVCSSGTHQAIEAKAKEMKLPSPYYGWLPALYGHGPIRTRITSSSGRAGLAAELKRIGFVLTKEQLDLIFNKVKEISSERNSNSLQERELVAIVNDLLGQDIPCLMIVEKCTIISGKGNNPSAIVVISFGGKVAEANGVGNGPIDASFVAVTTAAKQLFSALEEYEFFLDGWNPIPVTKGEKSLGDVYARIRVTNKVTKKEKIHCGHAVDADTNQAFVQAFANALSWLASSLEK